MKWFTLFIAAFAAVCSLVPPPVSAQPAQVEIQAITHAVLPEGKEHITFKLSGPVVPKAFTMDGGNPRLVIDFPGSSYAGKGVIPLQGGTLATAIRIGLHQKPEQKVRVVVDLAKAIVIQHSLGEFVEADRTLTVTIAADPATLHASPEEPKDAAVDPPVAAEAPAVAEPPAAPPPEAAPAPPILPPKEVKAEPPVQEKVAAEAPQLLDITFDGSTDKGEMVLFHLNDFHPPAVSAVEKDRPQVVCDFVATISKKIKNDIAVKGKFVQRIRTVKQKQAGQFQVVLDLSPGRDYDLQQVFFKNDNLFVLIVNELVPEKEVNDAKDGKSQ